MLEEQVRVKELEGVVRVGFGMCRSMIQGIDYDFMI
jgi:hypothetical protein